MIYDKLYDFQKNIVDKFKDRKSFGLFLDMGLGKTPLSLALAEANHCTKVLVITINSKAIEEPEVEGSWGYWGKELNLNYHNKKDQMFERFSNDILILNYESLFKRANATRKAELKENVCEFIKSCLNHNIALIIDESHKIKNLQSLQSIAINQIKKSLEIVSRNCYTYLLTGTPFTTGYIDLYAQLKILGCYLTKTEFIDNYCIRGNIPGLLGWQQPIVGYRNLDSLYKLIHQYALTIKSEEVVNLPDKIFINHISKETIDFKMFSSEKINGKMLDKYAESRNLKLTSKNILVNNPYYRNIAYPNETWFAETIGTCWLRARQLSIGFQGSATESYWFNRDRLDQLKQFLKDNEDNYVLFYNYTPELVEIYDICEELGYNIDVYCGEVKSLIFYEKYSSLSEEQRLVSRKNIILANFASGSTGMNWQNYNKCIIFSMPLYKDYEQGIKRIHRLGQKNTVVYHMFYQNNWLDNSMRRALEKAINYSEDMFEQDLKNIFQKIE